MSYRTSNYGESSQDSPLFFESEEQYHQSLEERMEDRIDKCWFCGESVDPDEIAGCCMNWDFATYHLKCGEKVASEAWKCPVCIGEGLSETYHVYHVNDSDNELAMQLDMSHSRICHVCLNGCCHDFRYVWEKKPAQWEFGLVPVCLGCFEDYESETKCSGCGIELHTEHEKDEACCNSCNYPEEYE